MVIGMQHHDTDCDNIMFSAEKQSNFYGHKRQFNPFMPSEFFYLHSLH